MTSWSDDASGCARGPDLIPWLQGHLSVDAAAEIADHVADCSACRSEADELRPLLGALQAPPPETAPVDLTPRIVAAVRSLHFLGSPAAAACAGLLIAAGVLLLILPGRGPAPAPEVEAPTPPPVADLVRQPLRRGVEWLVRSQAEDGSWDVARFGGQEAYTVGITSLALTALVDAPSRSAAAKAAVERGVAWLRTRQGPDGRFGAPFPGSLYNHGPATVALLASARRFGSRALTPVISRAIDFIVHAQDPKGGWGYLDRPQGQTNVMVSLWPLRALVLAREAGRMDLDAPIASAHGWLLSLRDSTGRVGYERPGSSPNGPATISAVGAYALAISRSGDVVPSAAWRAPEDLLGLRYRSAVEALAGRRAWSDLVREVAARQVHRGVHAGSWAPDRWARQGGRVYSTAMGLLALVRP